MNYIRNIGIGIGLAFFLFGAGAVGNSLVNNVKTTGNWYLKVAGVMATGIGISGAAYKLTEKKKEKEVIEMTQEIKTKDIKRATVVNNTEEKDPMIHLNMLQLADYECLNHLTVRFSEVGDTEAVEHCKKLQERMFELYYGKAKEDTTS